MGLHLLNVPQRDGGSLQEGAISHFLPSGGGGRLSGAWKQLQAAIILMMASCVMHMKGAVACRDRPSPGFYMCLSASECFPARGEDSVLLHAKVSVLELLSCTLCSNSEGRSARSEFYCKDANV